MFESSGSSGGPTSEAFVAPAVVMDVSFAARVGAELRAVRSARKLSIQQLADALEVAASTVQSYEVGRRQITLERFYEICEVLQVPAHELLRWCSGDAAVETVTRVSRAALLASTHPALVQFRRWVMNDQPDSKDSDLILLRPAAIDSLANLAGMSPRSFGRLLSTLN